MKKLLGLLLLTSTALYAGVVYYGDGAAVFIENVLNFEKSGTSINAAGDKLLYTDTNAVIKELGPNPDKLNLLVHPSFEQAIDEGSCSGCTASSEATEILETGENRASLEMAYSAATGCYTVTKTTSAQYSLTQMAGSCFVKTSATDVTFEAMVNGVSVLSKEVSSSDSWKEYTHAFVGGATSVGYRVCANTSVTDSIFVDECFLGAKDVLNKVGYDTGWSNESADFSFTGFGTPTNVEIYTKRQGSDLVVRGYFRTGTVSVTIASIVLPSKYTINASGIPNITSSGARVGNAEQLVSGTMTTNSKMILFADGVNNNNVYFSLAGNNVSYVTSSGTGIYADTQAGAFEFTVPVQGWQATFDSISDVGSTDFENEFSARITAAGAITSQSSEWISSITKGTNGIYTVNLVTDLFAATPSVEGIVETNSDSTFTAVPTTTSIVIEINSGGIKTDRDFSISVSRQGIDRKTPQINAILKDVVMSPNSSNGKPVSCSASISAADVVTNEVGDCIDSVLSTLTGIYVVTFNSGFFGSGTVPSCFFQFVDSGLSGRNINFDKAATSSSGTTYRTLNYASSTLSNEPVEMFCRGVAP